jgi:hypothetical protein
LPNGFFVQTRTRWMMRQGDSNFSDLNHPVCYVGHEKTTSFPLFKG